MRFLLDTHAFIWWIIDDSRLSTVARDAIGNPENRLYLSAASTWEIILKAEAGKISLPDKASEFIEKQLQENSVEPLPIKIPHTLAMTTLPAIHKDPFDRMLIAQSRYEEMTIITDDSLISEYEVNTLF